MSSLQPKSITSVIRPGLPYPLGATARHDGTQFSVYSPGRDGVEVCLHQPDGNIVVVALPYRQQGMWHGVIGGVKVGQRYTVRRAGTTDSLIDPYSHQVIDLDGDQPMSVVSTVFGDRSAMRLQTRWADTVVYELHVGSYTARHPGVRERWRGTYLGLTERPVLAHLRDLGVTAVELLPVHAYRTEPNVRARGMRNRWGYSTANFFAPHPAYASEPGAELTEFATMVDALHESGIEVILDVVYNHTCEGPASEPPISWRGLSPQYYLLDDEGRDIDLTGCGNTVDATNPESITMITDSLRHWVRAFGVDGFRFDLASAIGRVPRRHGGQFDPVAPLMAAIMSDPILRTVKLIAEPWDATSDGYQVGNFANYWGEWNDRFRDDVRQFWAGGGSIAAIATRITGSQNIFGASDRRPPASVNFVTAHDGFTLADLVSYSQKHNLANGENNRDGTDSNYSVNHGAEGRTTDPTVLAARARHQRALLATLLMSVGTPMLTAGDEIGHSNGGNNNPYCLPQDAVADPYALDWDSADTDLSAFVRTVLRLRRRAFRLRQHDFFDGPDLLWFGRDGDALAGDQWHEPGHRTLQGYIDGAGLNWQGAAPDSTSLLLVLHSDGPATVTAAAPEGFSGTMEIAFDSSTSTGRPSTGDVAADRRIPLDGPTMLVIIARD